MSNWFETNATKAVIIHTIVVAAAVWATFAFIFDENKVNLYEAKVERVEAEAREIEARNAILATRVEYLTEDNRKLTDWLGETPNTILYYENQLTILRSKLKAAEEQLARSSEVIPTPEQSSLYRNFKRGGVATSFLDLKTNTVFGVTKINFGNTADVNLTLPNGVKIQEKEVKAGETWDFNQGGKEFLLILDSIDWATQSFKSSIIEVGREPSEDAPDKN